MSTTSIERQFKKMGARVKVHEANWLRVNVLKDKEGEYFDLTCPENVDLAVLDVKADARHLLLMAKSPADRAGLSDNKDKFLCGHDERAWFVAAIPESSGAASVEGAMKALRPRSVEQELDRKKVKGKKRNKRHNDAYIRQGEWFFIPAPDIKVPDKMILKNEPLRRGRGKPHMAFELYRVGGTPVMVCSRYPNGLPIKDYDKLIVQNPEATKWVWQHMVREPRVYVRGSIRHSDHKTIHLNGWHRVEVNTESGSRSMRNVAFLD